MRDSVLWTSLAYLLYSGQVSANYASDYSRLCPGNNPVRVGTEVYTVSCDRTLASSLPIQKLVHIKDPTPEECARVCEQDRSNCFGMIWSDNACFQSLDPSDTQFTFTGSVVLTPPPLSGGKTPEQLEQEIKDCREELEEERRDPAAPPPGTNSLDLTDRGCNKQNDGKIFTYAGKKYKIRYGYTGNGKQYVGYPFNSSELTIQDCLKQCAFHTFTAPCKGVEFGSHCKLMFDWHEQHGEGAQLDLMPRSASSTPGCAAIQIQ
ncbi:hypothetical protein RU639_011763 [Aspergillus parasiticus]